MATLKGLLTIRDQKDAKISELQNKTRITESSIAIMEQKIRNLEKLRTNYAECLKRNSERIAALKIERDEISRQIENWQ